MNLFLFLFFQIGLLFAEKLCSIDRGTTYKTAFTNAAPYLSELSRKSSSLWREETRGKWENGCKKLAELEREHAKYIKDIINGNDCYLKIQRVNEFELYKTKQESRQVIETMLGLEGAIEDLWITSGEHDVFDLQSKKSNSTFMDSFVSDWKLWTSSLSNNFYVTSNSYSDYASKYPYNLGFPDVVSSLNSPMFDDLTINLSLFQIKDFVSSSLARSSDFFGNLTVPIISIEACLESEFSERCLLDFSCLKLVSTSLQTFVNLARLSVRRLSLLQTSLSMQGGLTGVLPSLVSRLIFSEIKFFTHCFSVFLHWLHLCGILDSKLQQVLRFRHLSQLFLLSKLAESSVYARYNETVGMIKTSSTLSFQTWNTSDLTARFIWRSYLDFSTLKDLKNVYSSFEKSQLISFNNMIKIAVPFLVNCLINRSKWLDISIPWIKAEFLYGVLGSEVFSPRGLIYCFSWASWNGDEVAHFSKYLKFSRNISSITSPGPIWANNSLFVTDKNSVLSFLFLDASSIRSIGNDTYKPVAESRANLLVVDNSSILFHFEERQLALLVSKVRVNTTFSATYDIILQKYNVKHSLTSTNCGSGYYSTCIPCPIGSFCPGDGFRHLCYNAPTLDNFGELVSRYTRGNWSSPECPFECIQVGYFVLQNSCVSKLVDIPVGYYYSSEKATALPCVSKYPSIYNYARYFKTSGHTLENSCEESFLLSVLPGLLDTDKFPILDCVVYYPSLTIQFWARLNITAVKNEIFSVFGSKEIYIGIGLIGQIGGWLLYLEYCVLSGLYRFGLQFDLNRDSGINNAESKEFPILGFEMSNWFHVSFSVENSVSSHHVIFYLNGTILSSSFIPLINAGNISFFPWHIAYQYVVYEYSYSPAQFVPFTGDISDLVMHRTVLPSIALSFWTSQNNRDEFCDTTSNLTCARIGESYCSLGISIVNKSISGGCTSLSECRNSSRSYNFLNDSWNCYDDETLPEDSCPPFSVMSSTGSCYCVDGSFSGIGVQRFVTIQFNHNMGYSIEQNSNYRLRLKNVMFYTNEYFVNFDRCLLLNSTSGNILRNGSCNGIIEIINTLWITNSSASFNITWDLGFPMSLLKIEVNWIASTGRSLDLMSFVFFPVSSLFLFSSSTVSNFHLHTEYSSIFSKGLVSNLPSIAKLINQVIVLSLLSGDYVSEPLTCLLCPISNTNFNVISSSFPRISYSDCLCNMDSIMTLSGCVLIDTILLTYNVIEFPPVVFFPFGLYDFGELITIKVNNSHSNLMIEISISCDRGYNYSGFSFSSIAFTLFDNTYISVRSIFLLNSMPYYDLITKKRDTTANFSSKWTTGSYLVKLSEPQVFPDKNVFINTSDPYALILTSKEMFTGIQFVYLIVHVGSSRSNDLTWAFYDITRPPLIFPGDTLFVYSTISYFTNSTILNITFCLLAEDTSRLNNLNNEDSYLFSKQCVEVGILDYTTCICVVGFVFIFCICLIILLIYFSWKYFSSFSPNSLIELPTNLIFLETIPNDSTPKINCLQSRTIFKKNLRRI